LQKAVAEQGKTFTLITQNVDRLHQAATKTPRPALTSGPSRMKSLTLYICLQNHFFSAEEKLHAIANPAALEPQTCRIFQKIDLREIRKHVSEKPFATAHFRASRFEPPSSHDLGSHHGQRWPPFKFARIFCSSVWITVMKADVDIVLATRVGETNPPATTDWGIVPRSFYWSGGR
jgi:hypothetical protein